MATLLHPSAQGLSKEQYLRKLRGARGIWGAGSTQVQSLRDSFHSPFKPFTPFKAPGASSIPPGMYDVSLDAQKSASERGLRYAEQDASLSGIRESDDFQTMLQKIGQARGYAAEDKTRATGDLSRQFGRLQGSQYQAARAAGVARGGSLADALSKRTANQAYAQEGIDTSFNRRTADLDSQQGALSLAFQRGVDDRATNLTRTREETQFFGSDIDAVKIAQAKQAGFTFPTGPQNEQRSPSGTTYRVMKGKLGTTWYLLPNGTVTKHRPK